jgi:hypothetical protein
VQGLDPQIAEPAAALAALQAQLNPQQQAEVDAEAQRLFAEVSLIQQTAQKQHVMRCSSLFLLQ